MVTFYILVYIERDSRERVFQCVFPLMRYVCHWMQMSRVVIARVENNKNNNFSWIRSKCIFLSSFAQNIF